MTRNGPKSANSASAESVPTVPAPFSGVLNAQANGGSRKLKQHCERWLAVHKTKIRHSTYLTYRSAVDKHILPAFGHLTLRRLRAQDLDAFYARKMEEGLSSSRIGAIHIVISMALQQAIRYRHATRGTPGFTLARH